MQVQTDFGPTSEREIELRKMLDELQQRYREEAQPILDELAHEHSLKVPRIVLTPFTV